MASFGVEWFVPPDDVGEECTEDKSHGHQLQLRDGEPSGYTGDALDDQPARLREGNRFGDSVGLASVFDIGLSQADMNAGGLDSR